MYVFKHVTGFHLHIHNRRNLNVMKFPLFQAILIVSYMICSDQVVSLAAINKTIPFSCTRCTACDPSVLCLRHTRT